MNLIKKRFQQSIKTAGTNIEQMFEQLKTAIANKDERFIPFFKTLAENVENFLKDEYLIHTDDADELLEQAEAYVLDDFNTYISDAVFDMFPEADEDDVYEVIDKIYDDETCMENISSNMWEYVNQELAQDAVQKYKQQIKDDEDEIRFLNRQYEKDRI